MGEGSDLPSEVTEEMKSDEEFLKKANHLLFEVKKSPLPQRSLFDVFRSEDFRGVDLGFKSYKLDDFITVDFVKVDVQ